MPPLPKKPVIVRKVGPAAVPPDTLSRHARRASLKYLWLAGAASVVLGAAYLGGGLGLALMMPEHRQALLAAAREPPPLMHVRLAPPRKKQLPEPLPDEPTVVMPAPEPVVMVDAPQPPPPPVVEPEPPAQPPKKRAAVVTSKKSSVAVNPRPLPPKRPPATVATRPSQPPEPRPAPAKPAPPSGPVAASQLDGRPRLLNSPPVTFPAALKRNGVTEGRVLLEVEIDEQGRVTVRRVLQISDPALESTARRFASAARFSPPRRAGVPVRTIFRWPLTLQP